MIKHGMEREKQNESHTLVHKHGFRENASSFSLFPTIKREFICTFIHSSVWWLSVALFGGQEGLGDNINSPYQKRSERWTWSCEKRGTSDEWWCTKHIYIYYYTYTIVQYIYELCHYMMFVYLLSVRFWKISCDIQDLRSSICRSWTNTSAHPLRYPRPVMKRRLVYPAFHPISTLRSCVLPESEVSTTSGVNGMP